MCALLLCHCAARAQTVAWLWDEALLPAWSTPEAAVLQRHILLTGDTARTRPRMRQPAMPGATRVTPVLHVEVSTVNPPQDMEASRAMIVRALLDAAAASSSGWVQLDMEAKPSQREFYRSLVKQLRGALPPQIKLSVTALAWWCRSPAWLDGLAADEVVPMFFRMGRDSASMRAIVEQSPATLHASCRADSAGFSPQEPFTPQVAARYRKTYWFDRHAWKRAGADLSPLSRSSP
ncbi:hypothetical protein RugamoR64_25420 [Duganella rhizosphaerae]|uniref:hypothetical protein n=1 Tax=Duganella rhizosphaerae TaxID=2885763 RepID=UPI0030E90283